MSFKYVPENGSFELKSQILTVSGWNVSLEVDGSIYPVHSPVVRHAEGKVACKYALEDTGLDWSLEFKTDAEGKVELSSEIVNNGGRPVAIGKANMFQIPSLETLGGPDADIVALPLLFGQGQRKVLPVKAPDAVRQSEIKLLFFNRDSQTAALIGFCTFQKSATRISYEYDDLLGIKNVAAYCDFAGFRLEPGKSIRTERFIISYGANPFQLLEDWADSAADIIHPDFIRKPVIGWLGCSWVDGINGNENCESIALGNADAINKRLGGFGVEYCWTSISNLDGGNPGDWLSWNSRNFPSGSKEFISKLQRKNIKLGLWCGPFFISSALTETVKKLSAQNALLKDDNGELLVVRDEWPHGDAGKLPKNMRPRLYALDPSHPANLKFIRQIFKTYREWGVRYYMLDFLEAGAGNIARFPYTQYYDRAKVAGPEIYLEFLSEIRKAAGKDTFLLGCTGPAIHNAGVLDELRTGSDFGEGRCISPDSFFYPASYVINNMDFWTGPQWALNNQAAFYYTHGKLFRNNPGNVLTVDKPIPVTHAQINATIHAMSGSSTMLGDDIRQISEDRLAMIKKTLPRNAGTAFPVDLFDRREHCASVFHRRVDVSWGKYDVVAFYNLGNKTIDYELELRRLNLDVGKKYLAWEFWGEEYIGQISGTLKISVPPLSVKVIRLTESAGRPAVLATDMHLLMGEMELPEVRWDEKNLTLGGRAARPAGEKGNLFIHAPDNLCVKNISACHISKDARDNTLIISMVLDFPDGVADWKIEFGKLKEALDMAKLDLA